jgi:hypothetical protein
MMAAADSGAIRRELGADESEALAPASTDRERRRDGGGAGLDQKPLRSTQAVASLCRPYRTSNLSAAYLIETFD